MTISDTSTITKADLDGVFHTVNAYGDDANRPIPMQRTLFVPSVTAASTGQLEMYFTPNTDEQLRALVLSASAAIGAGDEVKATLSVLGSDLAESSVGIFLLDEEPTVTLPNSGTFASLLLTGEDDDVVFLLRGVTYKLLIEDVAGAAVQVQCSVNTLSRARRA